MGDFFHKLQKRPIGVGIGILGLVVILTAALIRSKIRRSNLGLLSAPIQRGTITESVYGIGTVTARNSYQLKVGVTGTILRIFATEGDQVKKGQKLIQLDGMEVFKAPFDGTITYFPLKVGETVFAQGIILSLVDLLDRYIIVSLEQRAAIRVRPSQRAKISFENMRDQNYLGVVESIYSNQSQFLVRIRVEGLPPQILPGMVGDVAIGISEHKNSLIIPSAALELGKVLIQPKSGTPKSIEVKLGLVDGAQAEVLSGDLKEGDQVYLRSRAAP